jgi:hypothetical protein
MSNITSPWRANSTYNILQVADHWVSKPQERKHLEDFPTIGTKSKNITELSDYENIFVDGIYNRAVEDFSYPRLYKNLDRRGGFCYDSAGAVIIYERNDSEYVIVAGVHRAVYCTVAKVPIPCVIFKHKPNINLSAMRKKEAQAYTDEGYHLYKQTPDQALKAAHVAEEDWARDLVKLFKQIGVQVKGLGDKSGPSLSGYQTVAKTKKEFNEVCIKNAATAIRDSDYFESLSTLNSLYLAGLSVLLYFEQDLNERVLKSTINSAFENPKYLKYCQHGLARQNLALRYAKKYNDITKVTKAGSNIDLYALAKSVGLNTEVLSTDPVLVNG